MVQPGCKPYSGESLIGLGLRLLALRFVWSMPKVVGADSLHRRRWNLRLFERTLERFPLRHIQMGILRG